MSYLRITRAPRSNPGTKRLANYGKVEAVGSDGSVVDISDCVSMTTVVFKPGDIEHVELRALAFEVETPEDSA